MSERFEITRLVGKNATGGIYEATDTRHDRRVLLHRFYSEKGDTSVSGWRHLFRDMTNQWLKINNPGFLKMHDCGIDDDGAFMCTHYFESKPLLVQFNQTMDLAELYNFARQSCKTLKALHDTNIVHGALTPNSFLVSQETLNAHQYILADLGLTNLAPKINRRLSFNFLPSDPAILAPELFEGHSAVPVTDVYMLGHIFYYMVAGAHPLAELPLEVAEDRHFKHDFPRLDELRSFVPEEIGTWIQGMTVPHPEDRFQNFQEVIDNMPSHEAFAPVCTIG